MNPAGVTVKYGSQPDYDTPNTVVIGLGDPNPEATTRALILLHKGYRASRPASVSQFVTTASDELWSVWRQRIPTVADVKTVVVEDFSLDTCFAWLSFVARMDGRPVSNVAGFDQAAWVTYVTAWELGKFVDDAVETSAAALFAQLSHALLPKSDDDPGPGFVRSLAFLQELLDAFATPPTGGIPPSFDSELHRQAVAQFDFDRQQYASALGRGRMFQLLLPSSVGSRTLIVDALAVEEVEPTGTLKTMARRDRTHTWTHRGFGMLALYRPSAGRGEDMTFSLDPDRYLTLQALWTRLEAMEDERWGSDRPRDHPRRLASYLDADGSPKPGAPNEPWYDENGRYTLIGAPREDGSRLGWYEDVLPAAWELYFLRHVRERVRFDRKGDHAGKNISVAEWVPANQRSSVEAESQQQLLGAPSFSAWLAACSIDGDDTNVLRPTQLPPTEAFDRVTYDGGFAVVSRKGVTLFHETRPLFADDLLLVAERVAEAVGSYSGFLERYSRRLSAWAQQLRATDGARGDATWSVDEWERELSAARADILFTDAELATLPTGFDADRLRTSLSTLWGLHEQRDEMRGLIDRLDQLMRQRIARRTEGRERVYGALLAGAALAIVVGQLAGPFGSLLSVTPADLNVASPLAQLAAFIVGFVLFYRFGIQGDSTR